MIAIGSAARNIQMEIDLGKAKLGRRFHRFPLLIQSFTL
jgi:hypothetical protein